MNQNFVPENELVLISRGNAPKEPQLWELLAMLFRLVWARTRKTAAQLFRLGLLVWNDRKVPGWVKLVCLGVLAFWILQADFSYALQISDMAHSGPSNKTKTVQAGYGLSEFAAAEPESLREQQVLEYVRRYKQVAVKEMQRTGIPASITLAQAIIESRSGDSRLAKVLNNHFGIKCFSKKCRKGHCKNFTDDHHKDFFRNFNAVSDSYREHSKVVLNRRYTSLLRGRKDYKA